MSMVLVTNGFSSFSSLLSSSSSSLSSSSASSSDSEWRLRSFSVCKVYSSVRAMVLKGIAILTEVFHQYIRHLSVHLYTVIVASAHEISEERGLKSNALVSSAYSYLTRFTEIPNSSSNSEAETELCLRFTFSRNEATADPRPFFFVGFGGTYTPGLKSESESSSVEIREGQVKLGRNDQHENRDVQVG